MCDLFRRSTILVAISFLLFFPACQSSQKSLATEEKVNSEPREGKHLLILSGQSNMVGLDANRSFTPLIEKAFGKEKIIVVKDAHGGQSIRSWCKENHEFPPPTAGRIPKVRGDLYRRLINKVQSAMEDHNISTYTFIWMQGESDLRNKAYHIYLKELLSQLQKDLGTDSINVVIGRISDHGLNSPKRLEGRKYIRKTQAEFAEALSRGDWVNTDDLNQRFINGKLIDDLHYTKEGYHTLGQRFAEKSISLIVKHDSGKVLK